MPRLDRKKIVAAPIQLLEPRRLLSALFVTGTSGDDVILVDIAGPDIVFTVNGVMGSAPDATITGLVINGLGGNDTITLLANGDNGCSILGGEGDDTIHLGDSLRAFEIDAVLTVGGEGGTDILHLNDHSQVNGRTYEIHRTAVDRDADRFTNYSFIEGINLNCGTADDIVLVNTLASSTQLVVNGGTGGDDVTLASGTQTLHNSVHARVLFNGGGGLDHITIDDGNFTGDKNFTLATSKLSGYGGPEHTWAQVETGTLNTGAGNNLVNIDLSTAGLRFSINTGAGGDTVNATISNPIAQTPRVTIDTGSQEDSVTLNDAANSFDGDDWIVQSAFMFRNFFLGMDYANAEYSELLCGGGANRIDINSLNPDTFTTIRGGGGNDDIHVNANLANIAFVDGQAGLDHVTVEDGSTGILMGDQDLNAVTLNQTGKLRMRDNNPVVSAGTLSIDPAAEFDVYSGTFVLDYTGTSPLADIAALLATGYNNGVWNGPGINSQAAFITTSLGYGEAADLLPALPSTFAGVPVDATTLIIRYTRAGDADLNRSVNLDDFTRVAANFGQSPRGWSAGNFNYDAGVNLDDFTTLAGQFGQSLPADSPRTATSGLVALGGQRANSSFNTTRLIEDVLGT